MTLTCGTLWVDDITHTHPTGTSLTQQSNNKSAVETYFKKSVQTNNPTRPIDSEMKFQWYS